MAPGHFMAGGTMELHSVVSVLLEAVVVVEVEVEVEVVTVTVVVELQCSSSSHGLAPQSTRWG